MTTQSSIFSGEQTPPGDGAPEDLIDIVTDAQQQQAQEGTEGQQPKGEGDQANPILDRLKNPEQQGPTAEELQQISERQKAEIAVLRNAVAQNAQGGQQAQAGPADEVWAGMEATIKRAYTGEEQASALEFFREKYEAGISDQISGSIPDLLLALNQKVEAVDAKIGQQNAGEDPQITHTKHNITRVMLRGQGMHFNPNDAEVRNALFEGDHANLPYPEFENLVASNLQKLVNGGTGAQQQASSQNQNGNGVIPPGTINAPGSDTNLPTFRSLDDLAEAYVQNKITLEQHDALLPVVRRHEFEAMAR